ncbi:alpha/beta hydrolase [Malaciobacter pacificus]|uniref:Alpha/beta hydrolase family protein n=1 Tax=Malaciobacter pacificus TaxID=1080223 RepID=A0A5C2HBX9_9BACT|nr:alpha/beta hydrolase [Malaciobacter pacificus]QEP34716.1 alpha/beta hydrolase family protein [Malaciobacter pacificus]GGD46381.1 alpha/beta hydrolase [Malaciobacter pacificus]
MREKIYLIPGLMCDERLWSRLKPFLEDKYELIHLPIPFSDNFNTASKKLEGIIEDESINLLGFSLGAYLASYFTVKNPSKVKRLFLVAGTPGAINDDEITKRKMAISQIQKFGFKGLSNKMVLSLIDEKNHNDSELIDLIKDMFKNLGEQTYKIQMKLTFNRVDISDDLKKLDIPIKFFYSTDDKLLNYEVLSKFIKKYNHISIVSKEGTNHMIPLEKPEALSSEIIKWMSS